MMGHKDDFFSPEEIDAQIERRLSASSPSASGDQLLHDMQKLARSEQQLDNHSLAQVWQRVQAKREPTAVSDGHGPHTSFQAHRQRLGQKVIKIKEKETMKDTRISGGMNSSIPLTKTRKGPSLLRLVGLGLVAAVALITILSFTVFSGVLRSISQTTSKGPSTITGAQSSSQQPSSQPKTISNGKLVCSVGVDDRALPPMPYTITQVNWSAQRKIGVLATDNFTLFSAKDCSAKSTKPISFYEESWSPDGTKLVTASSSNAALNVLDSNGNSLVNIPFTQLGAISVGQLAWSSDGTKLIFISLESNHQSSIKSVDVANGNNVQTLMKISSGNGANGFTDLSPDGKYAVLTQLDIAKKQKDETVWNVTTGKIVSHLPINDGKGESGVTAFSPDSSLIAVGGNTVRIYRTTDGKFVTSFQDQDAVGAKGADKALAWSHDGRYLAESVHSINIYALNEQKIVATFGKVDAQRQIFSLNWAPDGTGLVSSTDQMPDDGHSQTPVDVWALS